MTGMGVMMRRGVMCAALAIAAGAPVWGQCADCWLPWLGRPGSGGLVVNALVVYDDPADGDVIGPLLFAGGAFLDMGIQGTTSNVRSPFVSRWNGVTWSRVGPLNYYGGPGLECEPGPSCALDELGRCPLECGDNNLPIAAMVLWDEDGPRSDVERERMYVAQGTVISRWNGTSWPQEGNDAFDVVLSMATFNYPVVQPEIDELYIGTPSGVYYRTGPSPTWLTAGPPGTFNGEVRALAVFDPDGDGPAPASLYAGGDFTTPFERLARWDGSTWHDVAGGLYNGDLGQLGVDALLEGPRVDGAPGRGLYVGGFFRRAGGVVVRNLAMWDGAAWHDVGGGVGGTNARALALEIMDPDESGPLGPQLFVGGTFSTAGPVAARRIARFDGTLWHSMGNVDFDSGVLAAEDRGGTPVSVQALKAYDADGPGGAPIRMYAAGLFNKVKGEWSECVAMWQLIERSECPPVEDPCPIDTNGDGVIDFADLNEVISLFNQPCP